MSSLIKNYHIYIYIVIYTYMSQSYIYIYIYDCEHVYSLAFCYFVDLVVVGWSSLWFVLLEFHALVTSKIWTCSFMVLEWGRC